jgi:outer membrane immunogenic protein
MKKYLLGIAGVLALTASGPAGAADLPVKAPPLLAAPAFNWSRCYVGVHAGYGWGRDKNDFGTAIASGATENEGFPAEFGPFDHNTSGGVAGAQAGCNWQWAPGWLVGIEGEVFWSGIKGSSTAPEDFPAGDPGQFSRFESRNLWDGDIALRLGHVLPGGMDLLYAKAGGVLGRFQYTEWHDDFPTTHSCFLISPANPLTCSATLNQTVPGWLVGVGWEHVLSIPGSWTFKAEFDFIGYPSHNVAYPSAAATIQQFAVTDTKAIFKVGVNHYFP